MLRIAGVPKDYYWGSEDAIPLLLGTAPAGGPVAELWFGAHEAGPARVQGHDGDAPADGPRQPRDLLDVLSADPAGTLGPDLAERFDGHLPYLLKLIAPARPVSLQVHPDLERARAGFAREEAAGAPAGERNYTDANHKPELLAALTPMEALCGFRAPRCAREILTGLDAPLARELLGALTTERGPCGMRAAFTHLLDPSTRPDAEQVTRLARACAGRLEAGTSPSTRSDRNVVALDQAHPGDPGVVAALLLNPVSLAPGEALFVPPGMVHAYLGGVGIEVQASSDNVLRAGLTTKRIDVPELLACVDDFAAPPIRIAPERAAPRTRVYYAPVEDFELSLTTFESGEPGAGGDGGEEFVVVPGRGPRLLLALGAPVEVASRGASGGTSPLRLGVGEALFVRADEPEVRVRQVPQITAATSATGPAVLVQAGVP